MVLCVSYYVFTQDLRDISTAASLVGYHSNLRKILTFNERSNKMRSFENNLRKPHEPSSIDRQVKTPTSQMTLTRKKVGKFSYRRICTQLNLTGNCFFRVLETRLVIPRGSRTWSGARSGTNTFTCNSPSACLYFCFIYLMGMRRKRKSYTMIADDAEALFSYKCIKLGQKFQNLPLRFVEPLAKDEGKKKIVRATSKKVSF